MAIARDNLLTPQSAPDMAPLRNSFEADAIEAELKGLFLHLFETMIRPAEQATRTLGTPHIGPSAQFQAAVKHDGLALLNTGDESAMRYVFGAWRSNQPRRGLAMLKTYMQLLWPSQWTITQMWQANDSDYPGLSEVDGGNHWLTSRVEASVSGDAAEDLPRMAGALRSVVPARIVLNVVAKTNAGATLRMAAGFSSRTQIQYFEGTAS